MRVLFTFAGGIGHFLPLVPFAIALKSAGDEVAFGGQSLLLDSVTQAGFLAFDTGGTTFQDDHVRAPLVELDLEREFRVIREGFARRTARVRAAKIIEVGEAWKPDLLVRDELDFGCAIAGERLGLPVARVLVIATGTLVKYDEIAEPLNEVRAEFGLASDPGLEMLKGESIFSPFPPMLSLPGINSVRHHSFRPQMEPVSEPLPEFAWKDPGLPLAYLTLGTVFNVESGDLFQRLLSGLSTLPINVVITVGKQISPDELGDPPPNIRIYRFIDQWKLLPTCDLVICHGGSGTVMGALAHGLPMVLIPMGADQPLNAKRGEELGVARLLDAITSTPQEIGEAVREVLSNPSYRDAATRVRREMDLLPSVGSAVKFLEEFVQEYKSCSTTK